MTAVRPVVTTALVVATLTSAAGRAWAGGGAAVDAYEGIRENTTLDVHGLVDSYVQLRSPRGAPVQFRAFDDHSEGIALDLLRVTIAHRPGRAGFRLDAGIGDTADAFLAADPAATRHPDLARGLSYVQQAFATVTVSDPNLAIDVGKFGTPVGLEDNETPQNWNYSRSLLFTLAEPTYHMGVRATHHVTDSLAISAFWLNGWNSNIVAGNGMRSFAAAVTWKAAPGLEVVVDYAGGMERAPTALSDPRLAFREELDAYAVYALRPWLSFAATTDYAVDASRGGVSWWGVGGYARASVRSWLAAALRAEHLEDPRGFITPAAQRMAEATATLEATARVCAIRWIGRLEFRRDQSDRPIFQAAGGKAASHQDTATLGVMAVF
jgi:hypothetical protein